MEVNHENKTGQDLIDILIEQPTESRRYELVKMIQEDKFINLGAPYEDKKYGVGMTALMGAYQLGYIDIADALIKSGKSNPAHVASARIKMNNEVQNKHSTALITACNLLIDNTQILVDFVNNNNNNNLLLEYGDHVQSEEIKEQIKKLIHPIRIVYHSIIHLINTLIHTNTQTQNNIDKKDFNDKTALDYLISFFDKNGYFLINWVEKYHKSGKSIVKRSEETLKSIDNVGMYILHVINLLKYCIIKKYVDQLHPNMIEDESKQIHLKRTASISPQDQEQLGICYAHSSARCITKLITKMIPDDFIDDDSMISQLYSGSDKYNNCFIENSNDIQEIIAKLDNATKCPLPKRYNHMLIYYYILYTVKDKYGCSGGHVERVMTEFCERTLFRDNIIFSPEIDSVAKAIINKFYLFVSENKYEIKTKHEYVPLYNQTPSMNWIKNIPENVKKSLKLGLYVSLSFAMPQNQWITVGSEIFNIQPAYLTQCERPITAHELTITEWNPKYVTIINSWGSKWGNQGFIKLPAEIYYKFIMSNMCYEVFYHNIQFSYFSISGPPLPTRKFEKDLQQIETEIIPIEQPQIIPVEHRITKKRKRSLSDSNSIDKKKRRITEKNPNRETEIISVEQPKIIPVEPRRTKRKKSLSDYNSIDKNKRRITRSKRTRRTMSNVYRQR